MSRSPSILNITDLDFDEQVGRAAVPTLLDFSAAWCAPCRVIAPHLRAVAEQHRERLQVAVVDVDTSPVMAERFGVRNLPTLLAIRGGQVVGQLVGAVSRARIDDLVARALG